MNLGHGVLQGTPEETLGLSFAASSLFMTSWERLRSQTSF